MRKVAVVTDSATNLPAELIERHHIIVVPVLLYIDGKEYRDGQDITAAEVYRYMLSSSDGHLPKTASPSIGDFLRAYTIASQQAEEVVSIHIAAKLSAIYQTACVARDSVSIRVHMVDTQTAAMGSGFAVLEAARLAEAGADVDAVIRRAQEIAARTRLLAALDRLDYLHRGGHVPSIAAWAGSALKICPVLTIAEGQARVIELPRTRRSAVKRLLQQMEKDVGNWPVHMAIMHADAPTEAEALHDQIKSRFQVVESFITEFTPVMGSQTGPGVIGMAYYMDDTTSEAE